MPVINLKERTLLDQVLTRSKHWLYMPDTCPLEVVLGAIAANKLPGDPVWLLLIATPGGGKTEILNSIINIPQVYQVATLTESSLLSGTPKKDSHGAKGGLLREVGEFGILQVKDFGSVLSLNKDSRGPILAALREVYDGAWTRYVGSDGGRTLAWAGKCGLVGGATPAIDSFYAVMSILGERFSYFRMPESNESERAEKALIHAGHETEMRAELAGLVADLFTNIDLSKQIDFTNDERNKLINLAVFTTHCRSAVQRESYSSREIELKLGIESPTRLVKVLAQLLRGLQVLGVCKQRAWNLVEKTALDSMPALRQKVVLSMLQNDFDTETSQIATRLDYPSVTIRRTLEDLACYGIVSRRSQGKGNADIWTLTDWTRNTYKAATATLSEIWGDINKNQNMENHISDKVTSSDEDTPPSTEHPPCPGCGASDKWAVTPDGKKYLCACGKFEIPIEGGNQ